MGFGLSNNVLPFFPICHQLSPSSHSQHLKISFFFLFQSFPVSSTSSCPFQFLSENLLGILSSIILPRWPNQLILCTFISYLPPTLSIFSLPALEDLILLPLSIFSWVFPFFLSLPVLEWRSFWASYPPFSLGDLTSLSFALLSILLYFLLCSSLLVLDSSDFSIPHFHI